MGVFRQPFVSRLLRWVRAIGGVTATAAVADTAAPSLRKTRKRRWVLPDGRRFYGTDADAAVLVAQIRAFQERLKAEADKPKTPTKQVAKAKKAKPKPAKPTAIFDIPAEMLRTPPVGFPLDTVYLTEADVQRALDAAGIGAKLAVERQKEAELWALEAQEAERLRALEAELAAIREWQKREEEDIEMLLLAA